MSLILRSSSKLELAVQGGIGLQSQVKFLAQMAIPFALRIKVCEVDSYDLSANASLSAIAGKSELIKTHISGKDLEFSSDPALDGEIWVAVTNIVAEQITIRIGPPEVGNLILDYSPILTFGHA